MKTLKMLGLGGLAASLAPAAFAQSSDGSAVSIEQIGPDNIVVFSSDGSNRSTVRQSGSGNRATIITRGADNGTEGGDITQSGENNSVTADVDGELNEYNVDQTSDGASNLVEFSQIGTNNRLSVTQDATGLTEGLANSIEVYQNGAGNSATTDQTALFASSDQYANRISIQQNGDGNIATTSQLGQNNLAEQEQVGSDNISDILQTGDDNLAIHRQYGDNLSLASELLGGIRIEQNGGASVLIEQYGPGQTPPPGQ